MTISELAHCGHLEAWSMPFRYAMQVLDLAIERERSDEDGPGRRKRSEPVETPGGMTLPPGLSQMARIFGMA